MAKKVLLHYRIEVQHVRSTSLAGWKFGQLAKSQESGHPSIRMYEPFPTVEATYHHYLRSPPTLLLCLAPPIHFNTTAMARPRKDPFIPGVTKDTKYYRMHRVQRREQARLDGRRSVHVSLLRQRPLISPFYYRRRASQKFDPLPSVPDDVQLARLASKAASARARYAAFVSSGPSSYALLILLVNI